jgi:hypothetical protein
VFITNKLCFITRSLEVHDSRLYGNVSYDNYCVSVVSANTEIWFQCILMWKFMAVIKNWFNLNRQHYAEIIMYHQMIYYY